jgi:hypothetical protein
MLMEIAFEGFITGYVRKFERPGKAVTVILCGCEAGERQEKQGGYDAHVVGL